MTEVIGWGDDEQVARRSRLRWRPPRWATAAVVAIAVVAVVVVPPMRSRLARDAAAWLATTWGERTRYDDARDNVVVSAGAKAGVADGRLTRQITADMDLAEATALTRLAGSISAHHTWAGDVRTARDAAVKALRSEVTALRADAAGHPLAAPFYAGDQATALITSADNAVQAAVRHHHAKPAPARPVTLRAPSDLLQRLTRPTDISTGLGLVLAVNNRRVVLDLDTGKRIPLQGVTGNVAAVGRNIVGQTRTGAVLFDLRGGQQQLATGRGVRPFGVAGRTIWLVGPHGYRLFTDTGRPLGAWLPDSINPPFIAMAQGRATLALEPQGGPFVPWVSWLGSGRRKRLPAMCLGGTGDGGGVFVLLQCGRRTVATVVDGDDGSAHTVPVPGQGYVADLPQPVSPDGRWLAMTLTSGNSGAAVVDLADGRVVRAPGPGDLTPAAWSPDGRWLLLAQSNFGSGAGNPRIALWRVGAPRLQSVRLPAYTGSQPAYVALVRLH